MLRHQVGIVRCELAEELIDMSKTGYASLTMAKEEIYVDDKNVGPPNFVYVYMRAYQRAVMYR